MQTVSAVHLRVYDPTRKRDLCVFRRHMNPQEEQQFHNKTAPAWSVGEQIKQPLIGKEFSGSDIRQSLGNLIIIAIVRFRPLPPVFLIDPPNLGALQRYHDITIQTISPRPNFSIEVNRHSNHSFVFKRHPNHGEGTTCSIQRLQVSIDAIVIASTQSGQGNEVLFWQAGLDPGENNASLRQSSATDFGLIVLR